MIPAMSAASEAARYWAIASFMACTIFVLGWVGAKPLKPTTAVGEPT
jgi:hypothetical protein